MRAILYLLAVLLVSVCLDANAQWTTSGNNIYNSNSGYVGIGLTTPGSKLEVLDGNQRIRMLTGSCTSVYRLDIGVNDNGVNFTSTSGSRGYNFGNTTGTLLTVKADGDVGIGTTAPDAKLAVKGQIHAQEVKVDLNGAIAPDYVFDQNYALPSLEQIQSYITANKHLPEVPSAMEMDEKGINLGEMNLLLLKKVEELTLYLIEQKQQIDELKEENRKQGEAIEKLVAKQ